MNDGRYKGVERRAARLLGRFPRAKVWAKLIYQNLNLKLHKKEYNHQTTFPIRPVVAGEGATFFGYYDRSPENAAGHVLANVSNNNTRAVPDQQQALMIAVFDQVGNNVFQVPTLAYNWQQGARALWVDSTRFIYNDFDAASKSYVGRLVDISTLEVHKYVRPVQDLYKNDYFLSLNYRRLQALRPDYGYRALPSLSTEELQDTRADGIWRVDFSSGTDRLIYTLAQAIAVPSDRNFSAGFHKFNHAMIAPEGDRFIVLHRRYINGIREDRLLVCGSGGEYMRLLADTGMVSHCTWISNSEILGYMRGPDGHDGYWFVDVETGKMRQVAEGHFDGYGDGHPHACGDWFVTDSYPDRAAMQTLLLCNWRSGETQKLGEFFHGLDFRGESRCDLHPRFSPDGKRVYFDSVFSGNRRLYAMELLEQ